MRKGKPTLEEIKEEFEKNKKIYGELWEKWGKDEQFYELAFKDNMNIPKEFEPDRVVVSTARDVVDAAINHTDIMNARIFVSKQGTSDIAKESKEMMRKFAYGLIHRSNVESSIAPGRVGAKHFWIYGLAVYKTVWDADRWLDKPNQNEGESEKDYGERLDQWRAETHLSLPIVIQPVNPACIMPDPYTGGDLYVMEWRKRSVFDTKIMWPNWTNPLGRDEKEEVEYLSYWDNKYRCELIDGEPAFKRIKSGVWEHKYGFIPYTLIESGLGNIDKKADPAKRYVGLLRYISDLLVSESTNYSLCDILMKRETMLGGYITGADAGTIGEVKQVYGKWWPVGSKDVKFNKWESELAPDKAYQHLALTKDYIAGHAAPRSVRGLSETGVRSGADRRLVLAEAAAIYQYSSPAFAHGWAKILNKCAQLAKNVVPGEFQVWAKTPTDEFDVVIKKELLREPFNYYVEFNPISEEDEYRRHEDLMRRLQAGIIDEEYAWERQSDVDPEAMRRRMEKKRLKDSPIYLGMKAQIMASMYQQALTDAGLPPTMGTPLMQQGGGQGEGGMGRSLVPGVPQRAEPGSAQERENERMAMYGRPRMNVGQGIGGGGNRSFGV